MDDWIFTFKYPRRNNVNKVKTIEDKNGLKKELLNTVLVNGTIPKQINEQNVDIAETNPDDSSSWSFGFFERI